MDQLPLCLLNELIFREQYSELQGTGFGLRVQEISQFGPVNRFHREGAGTKKPHLKVGFF